MVERDSKHRWLIVGLGNPGRKYQDTRHNIGFTVVEALARARGWTLKEDNRWPGVVGKGFGPTGDIHLLMPTTFMNDSGRAVQRYLSYHRILPGELLVIHDDIALDYGVLRLRPSGGTGGHNGIKSIQACLGISGFKRLRLGIGDREHGDLADYVLAEFSKEETELLGGFVQRALVVIDALVQGKELHSVMNQVNIRKKPQKQQLKEQRDAIAQENEHESNQ